MHFLVASPTVFCYTMVMGPLTIRKKTITTAVIAEIQATVDEHRERGRTHISQVLCQRWQWIQPNGALREMACRELLLTLHRKGLIRLPPRFTNSHNDKRNWRPAVVEIDQAPLTGSLSEFAPPILEQVRNTPLEPLYNSLIARYHYLGYRQIVGSHLKYIAFLDERPVACLGWGSAAWRVKCREEFIGWGRVTKMNNLHMVANNTRFLILPWVSVKCLASKVISLNAKRISADWISTYHHPLHLLETFVERARFRGTCYRAANWMHVGETRGMAKRGHDHLFHGSIKDVYLYPLSRNFRKDLCG
jgi:hypothetical protein